ncbi:MAG: 5-oxoprolinase, partial [Deltaproteobacteria bacterium]|nr:5-oxoprolinase [Deltaproteobacteria bacterium]
MSLEGWRLSLDRGGTFTDVVAHGPHGEVRSAKVLARTGDGLDAIAHVLSERERGDLSLRVGTTVATNALLTGTGAPTALMITRGFRDLPLIGHQARPDIFALDVVRPDWPIGWVVEVDERLRSDGFEERGVDDVSVREALAGLLREGCSALAVCLAHGVAYPQHELAVEQIARGMGFREVVVSHRVSRRDGLVDRAHASCLDASLTPSVQAFVRSVSRVAPSVRAHFMASDGGLVGPSRFRGRRALLSGPAGGVAACARLARAMGVEQVLGFDMGGTSTDVCRWAGRTEQREHSQLAGMSVPLPGVDVVSVAAGGGSRLTLCDGRAQVGPGSVGADPGPACYGLGSAAAVTDANLVLGRIQASRFPTVFGERGDQPLSMERARRAIASAAGVAAEDLAAVRAAAAGFLTVADEAMGEAIACLSVSRGHDPREHALVALGGAGPQHACSVAELLGVRRVLVHPRAGVLSAWGIAGAPSVATAEARVDRDWAETLPAELEDVVQELVERVTRELEDEGITRELRIETRYDLRYSGSQTTLRVRERSAFEDEHRRLFGFARPGGRIEVLRVVVQAWVETPVVPWMPPAPARPPLPTEFVPLLVPREGRAIEVEAALHSWEKLG